MTDAAGTAGQVAEALESETVSKLNAVLAFDRSTLLRQAQQVAASGIQGPLTGRAVAIKDNICTLEYPTTCASQILAGYQSPYEATAVDRLKRAGALIACKTNLDEFAMGSSTEHSAFGPTRHPTHPDHVPGGSSGGSAALVAAGTVDVALGSETGGSVRQPAAFCGVVGFKPSYGRVSRYGLVAFGSSLDQIGVFGRRVSNVIEIMRVISGHDLNDSTSLSDPPLEVKHTPEDLDGLVVGVPAECFPDDLDTDVRAACDRTMDVLRGAGALLRPVALPSADLAVPAYYVIAPAEASANLARYDGVRYGQRRGEGETWRRCTGPHAAPGSGRKCGGAFWWGRTCCRPGTTRPTTAGRRRSAAGSPRNTMMCSPLVWICSSPRPRRARRFGLGSGCTTP